MIGTPAHSVVQVAGEVVTILLNVTVEGRVEQRLVKPGHVGTEVLLAAVGDGERAGHGSGPVGGEGLPL